jgi:hypothetical protein
MSNLKEEDPVIQDSQILDPDMNPIKNSSRLRVLDALEDPSQNYYLKLNDEVYAFESPTLNVIEEAKASKKSSLANALSEKIERNGSDQTITAYLDQVDRIIDSSDKEYLSVGDVTKILSAYTQDVQNSPANHHRIALAKKRIYNLYLKKIQTKKSIVLLEIEKSSIDKRAKFKTNVLFSSILVTCFAELCAGYYCIYEVDWLGWDLVEPVTYSIGQGKFVLGTWFFCKYLNDTTSSDLSSFFTNRFKNKMYKKKLFEFERLDYLKRQMIEIDTKIEEEERNMIH